MKVDEASSGNVLLAQIRDENLKVYRVSPQRLHEDVGQENQIAQDYRGRLIYELLQNADDAMASDDTGVGHIRFLLTDEALWIGNSGRPLDEADVRGLSGISASSKAKADQKRRATIGHKGMGFKSVLEITEAPEVFSTTMSFRYGANEALRAVQPLIDAGVVRPIQRAPLTRFPWPVERMPEEWADMRSAGMRTVFRFPLKARMTAEKRSELADQLINLPVTTLLFLKHFRRVEFAVKVGVKRHDVAWTVTRERLPIIATPMASPSAGTEIYRVTLRKDAGEVEEFLLAHNNDIAMRDHRAGLDDFSWEGVEYTEVSIAARLVGGIPAPLPAAWRKLHIFLPSGEPCPYDLLVSGAFSSNVSRQEIRIEQSRHSYNRFLFRQVAEQLRDYLIPSLLGLGASVSDVLRLIDRGDRVGEAEPTDAAQALVEETRGALGTLAFVPRQDGSPVPPKACMLPPLVKNDEVGRKFRAVLPTHTSWDGRELPGDTYCGSESARVLADLGVSVLAPIEAAAVLAGTDSDRARAREDVELGVWVDPVLSVLEQLWLGLDSSGRQELAIAVRDHPLFPVGIESDRRVHRVATQGFECFYPPRSLKGEIPLDGLRFLSSDLCWGALNPRERNIQLREQMESWQALFSVREFKFPDVMRASVLPALELDQSIEGDRDREALHDFERLAAICQLAGRTPNPDAPLRHERLGSNRALFNLSRLDVPCRKPGGAGIVWMPAYRVYFGDDWIGEGSIEWVLFALDEVSEMSLDIHFLVEPQALNGLLARYDHLKDAVTVDESDIGSDEVGLDEDEEAPLDADERTRWFEFFTWLGVNAALRPVHFHDVEDRASGWLQTRDLKRPDGWAFRNVPHVTWDRFVDSVRSSLVERSLATQSGPAPYFYRLHDLEHLVVLLEAAARDTSASVGRALYEHLARNWANLERFARLQVALVESSQPGRRAKPPRPYDNELVDAGDDFWVRRLKEAWFCPTGHGPRRASRVWLPTLEVQRRFGNRNRQGTQQYLVPVLDVDSNLDGSKARSFGQVLGMPEELTPSSFSVDDARVVLDRLEALYTRSTVTNADLREIIRPAYRDLLELLSNRSRARETRDTSLTPLSDAPVLAQNGTGEHLFLPARDVFYVDRRETRDRVKVGPDVWTFVIEASPGARAPLVQMFGMQILEEALHWSPAPGELSLTVPEDLTRFREALWELAPYLLARIGAVRMDERLVRQDARRLRGLIEIIEPVTHLALSCSLAGQSLDVAEDQRLAHVKLEGDDIKLALVVWDDSPWPPSPIEAEALATALCQIYGAGYFESFMALIQALSADTRDRLLRHSGATRDLDELRSLLRGDLAPEPAPSDGRSWDEKTAAPVTSAESPADPPETEPGLPSENGSVRRTELFDLSELVIDGVPVQLVGAEPSSTATAGERRRSNGSSLECRPRGGYGGHTNLTELDRLGTAVTLTYERNRLRKAGLTLAEIFDPQVDMEQPNALIFDVSSPGFIERSRRFSLRFDALMRRLEREFKVSPKWPGCDVITIGDQCEELDRLIELKSSGVDARIQEMSWNEWKAARGPLRAHFYLYLVGNLRSDMPNAVPFVRTIKDPFRQLEVAHRVNETSQRKVRLAVQQFQQAEHLSLTVVLKQSNR